MPRFRSRSALARAAWLPLALACSELPDPAPREPDPASHRALPAGEVVGLRAEYGSHAWLGLPFAAPPTGALRWRAPRPAVPWDGVREALDGGPPCPQPASPLGGVTDAPRGTPVGSEDCLRLDVYAPRFAPDEVPGGDARLPVMVWIHGGGNTVGHKGFYHGGHLAVEQDVVVVVINYRLGPLGWLRHPALRGEGTTAAGRSGNFGNLDQIRALEWVQENVAAFGGDPGRVTVFGESAGGRNVMMLLLSPRAQGLFHRAVSQSGGTHTSDPERAEAWRDGPVPGSPQSSQEGLARMLVADGAAADRDAARRWAETRDYAEIEAFLRGRTPEQVLAAWTDETGKSLMSGLPQCFADGYVLPRQEPLARLARGGWNQVPLILGTNRDENKVFLALDPRHAERWLGVVPRPHDPARFEIVAEYMSRMWKATGADAPARAIHAAGGPPVWVYRFDWDEEVSLPGLRLDRTLGAAHGFEIPFVFGHWDLGPEAVGIFVPWNRGGRRALSEAMRSYWGELAWSGDPGAGREGDLPHWPSWGEAGPGYLVLDTPGDGGLRVASETVTVEGVIAAVEEDPRLGSRRERCFVYRKLAETRGFDRTGYEDTGCGADLPYDAFPWPAEADTAGAEAAPRTAPDSPAAEGTAVAP